MKTKQATKDRRGRILRNAGDRQKLIERFKASGMGKAEFCRLHGINLATFYSWFTGLGSSRSKVHRQKKPEFAEVQVALGKSAPIEIELPSRVCIRLQDAGAVGDLANFVREVGSC